MRKLNFIVLLAMAFAFSALALGVVVFGISVAQADPLPPPTMSVYVQSGRSDTANQDSFGPVAADTLYLTADHSGSFTTQYGTAEWLAYSDVRTVYGGAGNVTANATVNVSNFASAWATSNGYIQFFFSPVQTGNPGFTPPYIPISFAAMGKGSIVGDGLFFAEAVLGGVSGFNGNDYRINYQGSTHQDHFETTKSFWIATGYEYPVDVSAMVQAFAFAYPNQKDISSTATVEVDPIIQFDQAAFDAMYGPNSFILSDYYTLEFSPNVSVPEPSLMVLLGISMASIVGLRRWLKD